MISLSDYAGKLYAQPGMQSLLLSLQDDDGDDVLLLLMACWLGQQCVAADVAQWRQLHAQQAGWREQVIEPLRAVRRRLANDAAAIEVYEQAKRAELAAEYQRLAWLQQAYPQTVQAACSAEESIRAHLALCSANPAYRLEPLLQAATRLPLSAE